MKTDRFSSLSVRAAAVLLAGLLFAAVPPAAGQISLRIGGATLTLEQPSRKLSKELAREVGEARARFATGCRELQVVEGPDGAPAHVRREVVSLIERTGEDLDQSIGQIGNPDLDALRAWVADELRRVRKELAAQPAHSASSLPGLSTPRAVAVVASLGAKPVTAAPQQDTISVETSNRLLEQVGALVSRIVFLAERDDLEVELWVGSTPAPQATLSFWPQGGIKGSTPAPTIVRANGRRKRVLRGLYAYKAVSGKGPVTELIQYPLPAGSPEPQLPSERLDLVNGSSFFCCQFKDQYCHHVDDEKECRP